jgi:hypothetical protein
LTAPVVAPTLAPKEAATASPTPVTASRNSAGTRPDRFGGIFRMKVLPRPAVARYFPQRLLELSKTWPLW